jgi:uncharacterized membrane protein
MVEKYPVGLSILVIICLLLAIFTMGASLLALAGLWFCYRVTLPIPAPDS